MARRTNFWGARLWISLGLMVLFGCEYLPLSGDQVAGGGSHTGDDSVLSGTVTDNQGMSLGKVAVSAVPENFQPGPEVELNPTFQVMSDENGKFGWATLPEGSYNVFAHTLDNSKSGFLGKVEIKPQHFQPILKGSLKPTGAILIPFHHMEGREPGRVYFRGSPFYSDWNAGSDPDQDLLLNNLPAGTLYKLELEPFSAPGTAIPLADSVEIVEGETKVTSIPMETNPAPVMYPIDSYGLSGETLTDFPYLVRLNASNFPFQETGNQKEALYVTDNMGSPLKFNLASWDEINQTAELWVHLDSLELGGALAHINIGWGGKSSETNNRPAMAPIFNLETGYMSVFHGETELDISSILPWDAESENQLPYFSDEPGLFSADGVVGRSLNLGTFIPPHLSPRNVVRSLQSQVNWAFSLWFKATDTSSPQALISMGKYDGNFQIFEWGLESDKLYMTQNMEKKSIEVAVPSNEWQFLQVNIYKTMYGVYLNGELVDYGSHSWDRSMDYLDEVYIGYGLADYNPGRIFTGKLDEWRLSFRTQSALWTQLSYLNQKH